MAIVLFYITLCNHITWIITQDIVKNSYDITASLMSLVRLYSLSYFSFSSPYSLSFTFYFVKSADSSLLGSFFFLARLLSSSSHLKAYRMPVSHGASILSRHFLIKCQCRN